LQVLVTEDCIMKFMPPGVDTAVLIADTQGVGLGDFDISLMRGLINMLLEAYPDRLGGVYAGPLNMFVRFMYKLLSPALPSRILSKVHLMKTPKVELLEFLSEDQIPLHMKGSAEHPDYFDENGHFDYQRMLDLQQEMMRSVLAQ